MVTLGSMVRVTTWCCPDIVPQCRPAQADAVTLAHPTRSQLPAAPAARYKRPIKGAVDQLAKHLLLSAAAIKCASDRALKACRMRRAGVVLVGVST